MHGVAGLGDRLRGDPSHGRHLQQVQGGGQGSGSTDAGPAREIAWDVSRADGCRLTATRPQQPDQAYLLVGGLLEGPGDVLWRQSPADLAATARELTAHRVDVGGEAGHTLNADHVFGRA